MNPVGLQVAVEAARHGIAPVVGVEVVQPVDASEVVVATLEDLRTGEHDGADAGCGGEGDGSDCGHGGLDSVHVGSFRSGCFTISVVIYANQ